MSMSTVMATPTFIEDRRDFIGFDGGPAGYVGPPLRWDAVMKKLAWLLLGAALPLAACGGASNMAPGGVSQDEAAALNDAATVLDANAITPEAAGLANGTKVEICAGRPNPGGEKVRIRVSTRF